MGKLLKIGGPNLGPGQHTWVRHPEGDPQAGGLRDIGYGESIPVGRVADAQGYLDRGQATVVDDQLAEDAPATEKEE